MVMSSVALFESRFGQGLSVWRMHGLPRVFEDFLQVLNPPPQSEAIQIACLY